MIAVDTNVLVYAARAEMPLHAPALAAITRLAEARAAWALRSSVWESSSAS